MTRVTKRVSKQVVRLTDPHPTFVSLVPHGANQTPFKTVKHEIVDLTGVQPKETVMKKEEPTQEKVEKTELAAGTEIHKIVFKADNFKDEKAVSSYMDGKGYKNYRVDKVDGGFVVNGVDESAFESVSPLAVEEGVTMFVGKLDPSKKTDFNVSISMVANPAEERKTTSITEAAAGVAAGNPQSETVADPAAGMTVGPTIAFRAVPGLDGNESSQKATPKAKISPKEVKAKRRKVDTYATYYNNTDITIADVLEDANDGIPVGFYDITAGFIPALKNLVLKGDVAGISTLTTEYGTLITGLVTLTSSLIDKGEREAAFEKLFATQQSDSTSKEDAAKALIALKAESPAIAAALEPILALLAKRVEALGGATSTKEIAEAVVKAVEPRIAKVEGRVIEVERVRQVRRSMPAEDVTTTSGEEAEKKGDATRAGQVIGMPSRTVKKIL